MRLCQQESGAQQHGHRGWNAWPRRVMGQVGESLGPPSQLLADNGAWECPTLLIAVSFQPRNPAPHESWPGCRDEELVLQESIPREWQLYRYL